METVLLWDQYLFFAINHLPHTGFFDAVAQTCSGFGNGIIIWILACFLFFREEEKDHRFIFPVLLAGAVSWFLSELLLKHMFVRIRPLFLSGSILVGSIPDGFSFPSTHAVLAYAFAVILSAKEPRWRYYWYGLALAVGLSRIYLGHHYPLDVLAGAALGYGIGRFVLLLVKDTKKAYKK